MNSWIFLLVRLLSITIFPIVLKKYKSVTNSYFDLTNLSKMLFALFLYYFLGAILLKKVAFEGYEYFWFTTALDVILTIVYIVAILKYSPIRRDKERIVIFPIVHKRTVLYKMVILFFFLKAIGIYLGVAIIPERVLSEENLLLYAAINRPFVTIIVFLFITFFSAIGEELVFRYFAIHALLPIFSTRTVIILSALIWALMHRSFSLETIIFGIFLAYFYIRTGYLSICIVLHFLSNIIVGTGSFYVYFTNKDIIHFTPTHYTLALFIALLAMYHLTEFFMKKKPCEALNAATAGF